MNQVAANPIKNPIAIPTDNCRTSIQPIPLAEPWINEMNSRVII